MRVDESCFLLSVITDVVIDKGEPLTLRMFCCTLVRKNLRPVALKTTRASLTLTFSKEHCDAKHIKYSFSKAQLVTTTVDSSENATVPVSTAVTLLRYTVEFENQIAR